MLTISLSTADKYFIGFASKLPNIKLGTEIEIYVYDFESKEGKQFRGLGVSQNGAKLGSYYYNRDKNKAINGIPEPEEDAKETYDSDDWKLFFITQKKFLKKAVQTSPIYNNKVDVTSKESQPKSKAGTTKTKKVIEEDDDLPF